MAKIVVQKFSEATTNSGKTKYKCIGTIDGELDNFDAWDKPELNVEFEANVKDDPKWGKSISTGQRQGGGGGGFRNDPETRKEIIRQNSLTNAVAFCSTKARMMTPEEARKYLTGKEIVQVATYFAMYSEGKIMVSMTPEEVSSVMGYEAPKPEPKEEPKDEYVDPQDVPF